MARVLLDDSFVHVDDTPTLRHWRGGWWEWKGSRWVETELRAIAESVYSYTEDAVYLRMNVASGKEEQVPWAPTKRKVGDVLDALGSGVVLLREHVDQPSWINDRDDIVGPIVSCANGLLDVGARHLLEHHPNYWNQVAVPFDYNPNAPPPLTWFKFLQELWPDDDDQIAALQEWAGYLVSGRLDFQKILLVVGPTRGGKGVIARTFERLLGRRNCAAPLLSSLGGEFGLAPLLGKSLATVSDARLTGRDGGVVVERLLSISGEDTITVNRKYREQFTGKLPTRIQIMSNELPRFTDASSAIAGRFVILSLATSWLGREDKTLEYRIADELPGVLNWALQGLERLAKRDHFTVPASTARQLDELRKLASPVQAFVSERCVTGPDHAVAVDALYGQWKWWAADNGHHSKTKAVFGRDLHAATQGRVKVIHPGAKGAQVPTYAGIALA